MKKRTRLRRQKRFPTTFFHNYRGNPSLTTRRLLIKTTAVPNPSPLLVLGLDTSYLTLKVKTKILHSFLSLRFKMLVDAVIFQTVAICYPSCLLYNTSWNIILHLFFAYQPWQWPLGACAGFLAWINLVLFMRRSSLLGIYVIMFLGENKLSHLPFFLIICLFNCTYAVYLVDHYTSNLQCMLLERKIIILVCLLM